MTGGRFKTLSPAGQHKRHKWEPRELVEPGFARAHGFSEASCKCGAVQRWLLRNGSYWDLGTDQLVAVVNAGRPILRAVV